MIATMSSKHTTRKTEHQKPQLPSPLNWQAMVLMPMMMPCQRSPRLMVPTRPMSQMASHELRDTQRLPIGLGNIMLLSFSSIRHSGPLFWIQQRTAHAFFRQQNGLFQSDANTWGIWKRSWRVPLLLMRLTAVCWNVVIPWLIHNIHDWPIFHCRLLSQIRKSDGPTREPSLSQMSCWANILYICSCGRIYHPSEVSLRRQLGRKSAFYTLYCPTGNQATVGRMTRDMLTSWKQQCGISLKIRSSYTMGRTEMCVLHSTFVVWLVLSILMSVYSGSHKQFHSPSYCGSVHVFLLWHRWGSRTPVSRCIRSRGPDTSSGVSSNSRTCITEYLMVSAHCGSVDQMCPRWIERRYSQNHSIHSIRVRAGL